MLFSQLFTVLVILCLWKGNSVNGSSDERDNDEELMDELFDKYSDEIRPNGVLNISVQLHVLTINDLETKSQTLTTSGYFIVKWHDERLVWNATEHKVETLFVGEKKLWVPPLVISNAADQIKVMSDPKLPIRLTSDGVMKWMPPLLMKTYCDMDISFYPVDTQTCAVTMVPWGYSLEEVDLQAQVSDTTSFIENGEWKLVSLDQARKTYFQGGNRSLLVFTFVLSRRPMYYIFNLIIPSLLMTFLSPLVFLLPAESGERVSYIITVFLAFAVMLTMVSAQLPPSSITPSVFSLHLTLATLYTAIVTLLTLKNLRVFHKSNSTPIPEKTLKMASRVEFVLCRGNKTKVHAFDEKKPEKEVNLKKRRPSAWCDEQPTWKEIADTYDVFYFRVFMFLSSVQSFIFVAVLLQKSW